MNQQEFEALFGTNSKGGKPGRRPKVDAVTGRKLLKTDNITRQHIPDTQFYVMHTFPLSVERFEELKALVKSGPDSPAVKPPANKE